MNQKRLFAPTMMSAILAALMIASFAAPVRADDDSGSSSVPTFSRDVLPIFQASCQNCHRAEGQNLGGMIAPMSLMTFEDSRPWAKSIAQVVNNGSMPPWHASREMHGMFRNERYLTDAEISTITRWVQGGAPPGDPADAPPPREFKSYDGWSIGKPDLIVKAPRYFVEDDVEDEYVNLEVEITEEMLPEPRWIRAVEFKGGSSAVHHIIAIPLGGLAPGYEPNVYEEGMGSILSPGTKVSFNMHYHKEPGEGTGVWDESVAAIQFWEKGAKIDHVVNVEPLGNFMFRIPPGSKDYSVKASHKFNEDATILAVNPHMHLRGKAALYTASLPDGTEKVILDVPQYDFDWQHTYHYREPLRVPAGTKITTQFWWDNSADNPDNPDPTQTVSWGEPTTDEMAFGWMRYYEGAPLGITVGEALTDKQKKQLAESGFARRRRGDDGRR